MFLFKRSWSWHTSAALVRLTLQICLSHPDAFLLLGATVIKTHEPHEQHSEIQFSFASVDILTWIHKAAHPRGILLARLALLDFVCVNVNDLQSHSLGNRIWGVFLWWSLPHVISSRGVSAYTCGFWLGLMSVKSLFWVNLLLKSILYEYN